MSVQNPPAPNRLVLVPLAAASADEIQIPVYVEIEVDAHQQTDYPLLDWKRCLIMADERAFMERVFSSTWRTAHRDFVTVR